MRPVPASPTGVSIKHLSEKAYDHLVDLLVTHQLQPGNLIVPSEIARELGISVSPVTRALQRLEHEGFVKIIPKRASFVENSSPESIIGQMMMREAIECQAARIYCGKLVEENFDRVINLAQAIRGARERYHQDWEAEIAFHSYLVSLTGISNLIRGFESTLRLGFFLRLNLLFRITGYADDHVQLAGDLLTGDPDEAESRIRRHLRSGKPEVLHNWEIAPHNGWDDI